MDKKFNGTTVETNGVRSIAGGGTGATTAAQARTNLGLGTAATSAETAYATAAQGSKADSSSQPGHTHPLSELTQSGATANQVPTWNGTTWVPQTPASGGGANFQPSPEYLADGVSAVAITGGYRGNAVIPLTGTKQYSLQTNDSGDNHFLFKLLENRWRYQFEVVGSEDSSVQIQVDSLSDGVYPWLATWPAGFTASKNPVARLVGSLLASTASEGTSAYAARADHVHPFPSALQVGAAPLTSGKIPAQYLPSYVDDVIEASNFDSLPKITYTVSGSTLGGFVNGDYVMTASLYNGEPTYSNGNTLRRRAWNVSNASRWEIVDSTGAQRLLSDFNASRPDGSTWPGSVTVVLNDNSPATGKIYVTRDTGKCYRWTGSTYVEISNTLELEDFQIPDIKANITFSVSYTGASLSLDGTQNGKNSYSGGDGDAYSFRVFWTGTAWKGVFEYNGDGSEYQETIATGNTQYPWQATGWTNNGVVNRVGTYNAALAPSPLAAEAYSGIGTKAAREDHVHPLPTPAQVGAATAAQGAKADTALQPGTSISNISGLQTALAGKQAAGSYAPASGISPSAIAGTVVVDSDSRLTNSRTPTLHASSHASGGADPLTPADIGALTTLIAGHGSFNPAASGSTYFFSQALDLAPTSTASGREIGFPFNFRLVGASLHTIVGGTFGVAQSGGQLLLRNKSTGATSLILHPPTYTQSSSTGLTNSLNITISSSNLYVIEFQSPAFTTAPTSVRQLLTLFLYKL